MGVLRPALDHPNKECRRALARPSASAPVTCSDRACAHPAGAPSRLPDPSHPL